MKKETIDSIAKIIACALALLFLISVIHLTGICSAQIDLETKWWYNIDDFNDGEYNNNFTWIPDDSNNWTIQNETLVHINALTRANIIYTESQRAYGVWKFDFRFTHNVPINEIRYLFIAENQNLTGQYYQIYISSGGIIRLEYGGVSKINTLWIYDTKWHNIKILRNELGEFNLYFDNILIGSTTSNVYKNSNYIVIYSYRRSPNSACFDNITVYSEFFDLSDYCFYDPPMPDEWIERDQTYILWHWNFTNASVFIDGVLVDSDNDIGYYLLSGLKTNEKHRIDVYDSQNETLWYNETKTTPRMMVGDTILILLIGLILMILGLKVPLFFFPAFALFTYGGIVSINATTETYAILPFFTLGILSLFILALKFMTK